MEQMGALQPGFPSPTMVPRNWHLTVIDLKDCFFDISLHPDDAPKFAFSVPSTNMQAPLQRDHWVVLPQGVKNSPSGLFASGLLQKSSVLFAKKCLLLCCITTWMTF